MSSYDQNLLDEAPKATRAQLQEGYNVDLLDQPGPRRASSVRQPPASSPTPQPPAAVPLLATVPDEGSAEKTGSSAYSPSVPKPKPSFWRTRNGIIAIILVALVVVGAIVGGAVGGTVKKSSQGLAATTGTRPSSSPLAPAGSATGQGFGGVNNGATSTPTPTSPSTAAGQNAGGQASAT